MISFLDNGDAMRRTLGWLGACLWLYAGLGQAAVIRVQTLDESSATLCTLPDAVLSVNTGTAQGACPAPDNAAPNTIAFEPSLFAGSGTQVISLSTTSGPLLAALHVNPRTALTLQGPGADKLEVRCNAAITSMESSDMKALFEKALVAAQIRAAELGQEFGK